MPCVCARFMIWIVSRCMPSVLPLVSPKVFGAFATGAWDPNDRVVGTMECFLFSFAYENPRVYRATTSNRLYQIIAKDCLQMGGGG